MRHPPDCRLAIATETLCSPLDSPLWVSPRRVVGLSAALAARVKQRTPANSHASPAICQIAAVFPFLETRLVPSSVGIDRAIRILWTRSGPRVAVLVRSE